MKKLLVRLLCLLLIMLLVPSLVGCDIKLDFNIDFDFSSLFPNPDGSGDGDGGSGSIVIGGGTVTEWGGSGYDIDTTVKDGETKVVNDVDEANAILDAAIMSHVFSVTVDFTAVEDYSPETHRLEIELGNHVSISMSYYENQPKIVEFKITYHDDAAVEFVTPTEDNDHLTVLSGNLYARLASIPDEERRTDDFDAFPIDAVTDTQDVYNSEELWWALSRGYRPTFPLPDSKAESFYLEAKNILRDIVTDSMTDYEKLLTIYEYLVCAVEYDYDSFYSDTEDWHKNACYYLEGVFESGRAVCDGKAKAFVLFAAIEGIECVRDFGRSAEGAGHAWNYVKLDGLWYLVDTTAGDALMDGSVGEFLGDSAEITDYGAFLQPINYHGDEYIYSPTWREITEGEYAADTAYATSCYEQGLFDGSSRNFVIDKAGELSAICELALGAVDSAPFSIAVKYDYFLDVYVTLEAVARDTGYEYAVFVLDDAETEYLILFSPIPEPTLE